MMTYGALCWAHKIHTGSICNILRNLNRAGLNTFSNFPRSTPTRTVEIITDTLPLHLQALKVGLSARIRLRAVLQDPWQAPTDTPDHMKGHIHAWDQMITDCNLEEFMETDDSVLLSMPFSKFAVCTESFSGNSKYLSPSQLNVYTDGSKFNNKVGAGVFIHKGNINIASLSFRLPDKATVFQAEIFAINRAAIFVQSMPNITFTKFFVDSQAALQALNKKDITSRLVGDTVHNLNLIPGKVRLVWIKAHVGHDGNEKADGLAKLGTSLFPPWPLALPKQATKFTIKEAIDETWKLEWTQYHDGRQSKQFYPLPNRNKAKYSYNLNRQELGRLIRIVTGHNNLLYHRSNVDKSGSTVALCCFCNEFRETFYHFVTECPCFRLSRFHYFQKDSCFDENGQWSIRKLLDFSKIPSIDAALGGSFDPMVHLEQQRDFEDIIEAEQDDANDQPGRTHDPDNPQHLISTSDSDSSQIVSNTQELDIRRNIASSRRIHHISTSSSGSISTRASERSDIRSTLGPEAGSRVTDSPVERSHGSPQACPAKKRRIDYETLELTDDDSYQSVSENNDNLNT